MADKNEVAQAIADFLFRDGTNRQADRLLLITEDYSGKAKVADAQYLGGWSKAAVIDAVNQILKANKISPSDFEQLIRLRKAGRDAVETIQKLVNVLDLQTQRGMAIDADRVASALNEALAHTGEKS